jgi:pimeloyl-ACP methyl ester carboxylesterase
VIGRFPRPPFTPTGQHHRVDGRSFDLFGPEDGPPMIWFHGSPSCRLEARLLGPWAQETGRRVVALDRPGLGQAALRNGWTMADVVDDAVHVADHLGWRRFGVAGGSGGGPYVLAAAHFVPERLSFATALACAGDMDHVRAGWVDRLSAVGTRIPGALATTFGALRLGAHWVPGALVERLATPLRPWMPAGPAMARLFADTLREATRQGVQGVVQDTEVLHRPWGFDLDRITFPVTLVAGDRDPFIPRPYTEHLMKELPSATLEVARGDDHFRTIFDLERLTRLTQPVDST